MRLGEVEERGGEALAGSQVEPQATNTITGLLSKPWQSQSHMMHHL